MTSLRPPQSIAPPKRTTGPTIHPYAKYHSGAGSTGRVLHEQDNAVTIYSSAFANNGQHVVGCTSNGVIAVWNVRHSFLDNRHRRREEEPYIEEDGGVVDGEERGRKRSLDSMDGCHDDDHCDLRCEPLLCVRVEPPTSTTSNPNHSSLTTTTTNNNNTILYDVQFLQNTNTSHSPLLLAVSGDPGILLYKWSDFERAISQVEQQQNDHPSSTDSTKVRPTIMEIPPLTCFRPHPSPTIESIEMNSTSLDGFHNWLYGAAGDGFGCYQWDLESERLLGTFGGRGAGGGGGGVG
eukprot:CCRYP_002878-RA/>CCRYP_002878-RA protein AED:0.20 eAED:0.20 QI:44/1/1/1/1/0.66/3/4316/292